MRLYILVLFCVALTTTCADPEPKKYRSQVKNKNKATNTTLTADEKKFLREVEEKFGIKSETHEEEKKTETEQQNKESHSDAIPTPTHFPAVIAIEIVNDTNTKTKGKRTIDANLGYGYKTNNGYTYSYFGRPGHDKGKFMIYPYSQEDIPAPNTHSLIHHYDNTGKQVKTTVEISPSQAFELVEDKPAYNYEKPSIEFKTPTPSSYSSSSHASSDQGSSYKPHPSTLYTTYNGEQFSGLSSQFPTLMPNYLVDPSQLIKNPEYQNVGLTQDHLRPHGNHLQQKVVPVLVLRIPSSSLTNPTAELYADLPNNYPLSNYLNHLNLQNLVNQYFKKIGYNYAPQVMAYPTSLPAAHGESSVPSSVSQYEPQHYAHPYVQPSYTHSHHSGVQYSAVQPVMARYPSSYPRHYYMSGPRGHSLYKQHSLPQKYEYQHQYVHKSPIPSQQYQYMPMSYYQQHTEHLTSDVQHEQAPLRHSAKVNEEQAQFEVPSQASYETAATPGAEYGTPESHSVVEYETQTAAPEYGTSEEQHSQSLTASYGSEGTPTSDYGSHSDGASQEYYTQDDAQKESHSGYASPTTQPESTYQSHTDDGAQNYVYQTVSQQDHDSNQHGLVLSENYPSKDHTIATVLPSHYQQASSSKPNSAGAIQTVSYVTPTPYSSKYQMPYKIMVPQTFLYNPSTEKVAYVNSQSAAYSHSDYNAEAEYTVGYHYVPPVGKQKPPSYPRNYHSHPKRMAKPHKSETHSTTFTKSKSSK